MSIMRNTLCKQQWHFETDDESVYGWEYLR